MIAEYTAHGTGKLAALHEIKVGMEVMESRAAAALRIAAAAAAAAPQWA
jgi:hypothetical protein